RNQARRRLREGFKFSEDQALVKSEETIKEIAQRILRDKLGEKDVKAEAIKLAKSALNEVAGSSRLSRLRKELRNLNAPYNIVEATKTVEITEKSNKIQASRRKIAEDLKKIDYPDHFTLRIDSGVTGFAKNRGQPDIPRKFRSMEKNQERAKELLTWVQNAISSDRIGDPGKPGVKWFNGFLKSYGLISRYLRKMGAVYAIVAHGAKNLAHAMTIAQEALRHSPDNNISPTQNYAVVNYRPRGVSPEKATPFQFCDRPEAVAEIVHKYFERPPSRWNITDFLEECDLEPFNRKIESYTASLEVIADMGKYRRGKKYDKARQLLIPTIQNFGLSHKASVGARELWGKRPDYKVARKWKECKEHNSANEPSVTITENTIVGPAIFGVNKRTFITNQKEYNDKLEDDYSIETDSEYVSSDDLDFSDSDREEKEIDKRKHGYDYDGDTQSRELPRPSRMEPGVLYSDPKLHFNDQEWMTGYATLERLNATTKDKSLLQNITDIISKGVLENISGFFSGRTAAVPQKNTENNSVVRLKNIEQDSDEELSNRM
ncbi:7838_t:CDS:10, partial [Paraglomus occultum]